MSRLWVALHIARVEAHMQKQKIVAIFLASLLMSPTVSLAQEPGAAGTQLVSEILVATPTWTLLESAIHQAELAANETVQAPQNRPSWPSRHPIVFGTIVGLTGGLFAGLVAAQGCDPYNDCEIILPPLFALGGTVVGALTGAIVGHLRK